ncbi:MAG: PepSY-like domain-containing protein [Bacteroidales bacterium]|nr:PepSY-like domain-containing protein [Bacteroidales bacterium]
MKRIITTIAMLAAAAMTLISCETFEDGKPLKNVREAFAEMYPDARDVEWDMDVTNWKVSFELGTPPDVKDCEAWYGQNAKWIRTETDILESALPQVVKDALAASEYATAVLDAGDIEYVETPDGNFYQLEVTLKGLEVKLKVSEDGKISLAGVDF